MIDFLTKRVSPKTTSWVSLIALIIFLPFLLLAAYQTVTLISRATGKPANIVVDTKAVLEPFSPNFYHAFAQGGEESTDMLAPIVNEVRTLKPKLIRLDHIFDHYDVVGRDGNGLTFNFTKLDAAVDTILATGAKPLLSLSFMPSVIAKDGQIINPPQNWDEWALVIQRTIEYYSGKSGKNLSGLSYEVWNEPDLSQFGGWKLSGEKNYLTLYRYAARGASNAKGVNAFYLGGPATTGLYQSWILALVKSGYRLDFFSWHSYLDKPKKFADDQRQIISWLLPYPNYTLLPKLITEFGFTGNKDKRYGTTFAAAHTAAVVRQLASGGPTYIFSFQLKDGPGQTSGEGWGLITHESEGKKPKPRYYVYNFLDNLAGRRLALSGEGTWVTGLATIQGQTIRVLLVNFDPNGSHSENVPLAFTNLDPGNYLYRERFLFGRDVSFREAVTTNTLTKQVYLPAQSIAILELSK